MKIFQIILLALLPLVSLSQKNKVQSAWRALNDYESTLNDKPDFDYLKKAKENIDLATANEETKNQAKTYAYKCRIMYNIYQYNLRAEQKKLEATVTDKNDRIEAAYGLTPLFEFEEAGNALDKIKEVDPKYFDNIMNVMKGGNMPSEDDLKLANVAGQLKFEASNIAVGKYKAKDFDKSAEYFYKAAVMNSLMTGKKDTASFYNACISAQKAKNLIKMIDYNKKMIDQKIASPYNYQTIYDTKLAQKDTAGAIEYLKAGRKTYPNDVYLMNRETEIFLQKGEQEKALANLQAAIEKEPTNPQLQLVLGNVYDNIANPKGKSGKDTIRPADFDNMVTKAAEHYQKAIDLKPTNQESYFSALYNIGALYNNYGGTLQTKASNLSLAEAKTKGKELEAKSQEFYKKAIPYLEQALTVKSDDKSCMIALRKLYYLTGNEAAGKAMSDKLKGGK